MTIRSARPADVRGIKAIVEPYAEERILLGKELVDYFEAVQEFIVAESDGELIGCGALHVMWEDLAEVRTLAVKKTFLKTGIGHELLESLLDRARDLGIARVFCLTFEVPFFAAHGFTQVEGEILDPDAYTEVIRSRDDGVAEFLDLARVKPNTLGNTRMLREV